MGTASAVPALDRLDWPAIADAVDRDGFALTPPLLDAAQCGELVERFDDDGLYRATIVMARYQFGEGTYRYFADPLVPLVQALRTRLYPPLARIANRWASQLGERPFPAELGGLLAACAGAGQHRPTPLILRYGPGGYNCMHQDVYGELTFPLQVAILLNRADVDFSGGENVFVEQRPRAQSRASVARPELGQGLVFPVRYRPVPSVRGYKRVQLRHGVSTVHSGQRHVLGIVFHNAK